MIFHEKRGMGVLLCGAMLLGAPAAHAEQPGRGLTGPFEKQYLEFIIDHHYAALRMTELAAGTQVSPPSAAVSPSDRNSPSPNFAATLPKASSPDLLSLARRTNRTQREEILTAQTYLRDWYGEDYQPHITGENAARIAILQNTPPGDMFNIKFSAVFSRHHFLALVPSVRCQTADDVLHIALERYCRNIVNSQLSDIDEMRHLLADQYGIVDYQPLRGLVGESSKD